MSCVPAHILSGQDHRLRRADHALQSWSLFTAGTQACAHLLGFRNHGDVVRVRDFVGVALVVEATDLGGGIGHGAEPAAGEHARLGGAHRRVDVKLHDATALVLLDLDVVGAAEVTGITVLHATLHSRDGSVGLLGLGIVRESFPLPELRGAAEISYRKSTFMSVRKVRLHSRGRDASASDKCQTRSPQTEAVPVMRRFSRIV